MAQKLGTERQGVHILSPWIYRGLLSAIYLWAGLAKFADLSATATSLRNYHLMPEAILPFVSMALPSVEIILGVLLLVKMRPWVSFASALLASQFLIANSSAVVRGLDISCGCFGSYSSSVDIKVLALNVVMIVMSYKLTARYSESDSKLTGRQTFVGACFLLVALTSLSVWWISRTSEPIKYKPTSGARTEQRQKTNQSLEQTSEVAPPTSPAEELDREPSQIEFIPPLLDLGEIRRGESKYGSVSVVNHGTEPLRITAVGVGCQCVEANLATTTLLPGLYTPINIRFTAESGTGRTGQPVHLKFEYQNETTSFDVVADVKP